MGLKLLEMPQMSHILFAGDFLLFSINDPNKARKLNNIFDKYQKHKVKRLILTNQMLSLAQIQQKKE